MLTMGLCSITPAEAAGAPEEDSFYNRAMLSPSQRFRILLAWAFAAAILGRGVYLFGQRSKGLIQSGTASRHLHRVLESREELRGEALGPLEEWVHALRTSTPKDAIIAFSPPADIGVALPQTLLALRLLCYPRRIRLAASIIHEVEATGAMPAGALYGLNADPNALPPFPEAWEEVLKTKSFRLDRYKGPPR